MNLYIKQKVFSWKDKFRVYDENQNDMFYAEGEVFSIGKKLHLFNNGGEELLFIHQKVLSFLPRYFISQNGEDVAEVVKNFTILRQKYIVKGFDWVVDGDFFAHEYNIMSGDNVIASVSKQWLSWGDTYKIDIVNDNDVVPVLGVVLVIDAVISQQRDASSSASNN